MSLRRAVARLAGVDDLDAAVAAYERSALPAPVKAGLRLADAFLRDPAGFGEAGRRGALERLRPEQIVELTLKLVSFSSDKTAVALSLDAPAAWSGLSSVRYEDGVAIVIADSA